MKLQPQSVPDGHILKNGKSLYLFPYPLRRRALGKSVPTKTRLVFMSTKFILKLLQGLSSSLFAFSKILRIEKCLIFGFASVF